MDKRMPDGSAGMAAPRVATRSGRTRLPDASGRAWRVVSPALGRSERRPAGRQRGRMGRAILVVLAVVAVAGAGIGYVASHRDAGSGGNGGTSASGATGNGGGGGTGSAGGGHGVTPALTISTTRPAREAWPRTLGAQGSISAWQEVVLGPEVGGMRIAEVRANVGDSVRRGAVLATLEPTTLANDLASQQAALAEAKAALAEARANAAGARRLQDTGAISQQQVNQHLTAEQTARARVTAAEARIRTDRLRLAQASIEAPDDGVISARLATPGAVAQAGQELFRLIRGGRLEWRAEVPAADLGRIREGTIAIVTLPDGSEICGRTRVIAPTVDPATRNGLVYVDLPGTVELGTGTTAATEGAAGAGASSRRAAAEGAAIEGAAIEGAAAEGAAAEGVAAARRLPKPLAGMFARGRFELGEADALALPAAAVAVRDGHALVFRVHGDRVEAVRVTTGRRAGERIEIVSGLGADDVVAATGVGFLADGDVVSVVADPAANADGPR